MVDFRRIRTDLLALSLLAVTLFVALALFSYDPADPPSQRFFPARTTVANLCGPIGAQLAHYSHQIFGWGSYFLLFTMFAATIRLFAREQMPDKILRVTGWMFSLIAICIALHLFLPGLGNRSVMGSGGYVGGAGGLLLNAYFSMMGSLILIVAFFSAGVLLSDETYLVRMGFGFLFAPAVMLKQFSDARHTSSILLKFGRSQNKNNDGLEDELEEGDEPTEASNGLRRAVKINPPAATVPFEKKRLGKNSLRKKKTDHALNPPLEDHEELIEEEFIEEEEPIEFVFPPLELLEGAEDFPYELLAEKAQEAAVILEKTFSEFGLNVRVSEVDTGPVVTQFELKLEPGLRVAKVQALEDDIAIALRVPSVRVVSPIPGKNTVGVEVPNEKQVLVRLRELVELSEEDIDKMAIPIFLGKDVSGRPLVIDMAKMPHLLIAGRTGTGKSVCLNTLILSMLMTRSPDEVKMLMIDPKMVELSPYKQIPHLMHPVITDMKKAEAVLGWAVEKMEERYKLLAKCGVRHLDSYNKLGKEEVLNRMGIDPTDPAQMLDAEDIPEKMPYIVVVADEMADMMMTSGKDVEGHIIRLAQKSRAVGIHLVLATQKPTVDVITGLIKSNLPARISFQVASKSDSRVVLDESGAERLLGNGDMLYLAPGTSSITRAQGAFVSGEEIDEIIEYLSEYEPQYNQELAQLDTTEKNVSADTESLRKRDELYEEAIDVVIREGRGSVSLLQRALGIGYGRGARLIDYMAEDGIVGEYNGSQAREVLYSPEEWDALREEELVEA
ncbi:DNA translocase FtsK [hydrothermal vent metagenome]|uniref:DNA translocase FtsK n=1 Tax=hydrothermal vent metagenome TaxID=652676 RepID=A0A3B1D969_9ZZZZ